jgi:glycosyltransferase involved in cell wall biosynthesis
MDQRVRREAEVLKENGAVVHVICLRGEGERRKEVLNGISIFRVPQRLRRTGGYFRYFIRYFTFLMLSKWRLTGLFIKYRYDAIHIHSLPDFLVYSAFIPKMLGSKVVLDLHEGMPEVLSSRFNVPMNSRAVYLAKIAEKVSVWFAEITITTSKNRKDLIARRTHEENIEVVMNLPKRELYKMRDMTYFVRKNNLEKSFIVSYIGGLNPERELDVVLHAIKHAEKRIQEISFIFCGTGEEVYVDSLKRLIERLNLGEKVIYMGYVPQEDVLNYVNISNVALSPYKLHPNLNPVGSTKIFEYFMVQKPVIVADYPANREEFGDLVLYYRSSDQKSLGDKIFEVYGDESRFKEMGRVAHGEIFKRYDPKQNEEKFVGIYSKLMMKSHSQNQ